MKNEISVLFFGVDVKAFKQQSELIDRYIGANNGEEYK